MGLFSEIYQTTTTTTTFTEVQPGHTVLGGRTTRRRRQMGLDISLHLLCSLSNERTSERGNDRVDAAAAAAAVAPVTPPPLEMDRGNGGGGGVIGS